MVVLQGLRLAIEWHIKNQVNVPKRMLLTPQFVVLTKDAGSSLSFSPAITEDDIAKNNR